MSQYTRKESNLQGSTCSSSIDSSAIRELEEQVASLRRQNNSLKQKISKMRQKNKKLRLNRQQLLSNIQQELRNQDLLRQQLHKLSAEIVSLQHQMCDLNTTVQSLQDILQHKHCQTLSLTRQLERLTTKSLISARKFGDQINIVKGESAKQLDELRSSYRQLKQRFEKTSKRNLRQQIVFTLSDDDDTADQTRRTT